MKQLIIIIMILFSVLSYGQTTVYYNNTTTDKLVVSKSGWYTYTNSYISYYTGKKERIIYFGDKDNMLNFFSKLLNFIDSDERTGTVENLKLKKKYGKVFFNAASPVTSNDNFTNRKAILAMMEQTTNS